MNRLKELRTANKMSITELYEATKIARSTLSAIELGKRRMNINHAKILSNYFGVSLNYILGYDEERSTNTFLEKLEELFTDFYDDIINASINGNLDERAKTIFKMIDSLLHDNLHTDDIKTALALLGTLKKVRSETK